MTSLPAPSRATRMRQLVSHVAFWGVLLLCTAAVVRPLWIGHLPGLQDFGAHLILTDAWIHLDDNPLFASIYEANPLQPGLLPALLSDLLYPLLDPLASMRLFVTLSLVATVAALLFALHAFGRWRWLAIPCLPFLWGSTLTYGFVNFLPILALMLLGAAFARRVGLHGRWLDVAGLLATGLMAIAAHGMGYVYVAAISIGVLLVSLTRWRHGLALLALAPSTALWWLWFSANMQAQSLHVQSASQIFTDAIFFRPREAIDWVVRESLDVLRAETDTIAFCILGGVWVLLMSASMAPRGSTPTAEPAAQPEAGSRRWQARAVAALRTVRSALAAVYGELRSHAPVLLVVAIAVAYFLLPAYLGPTTFNQRLVTPLMFAAFLLPTPAPRSILAVVAILVAIATTLWFGRVLAEAQEDVEITAFAPIARLAQEIPPQASVECLADEEAIFLRHTLIHNCPGLLAYLTRGYTGGGFADTDYNAVRFQHGPPFPRLSRGRWQRSRELFDWDYVVVHGDHTEPAPDRAERLLELSPDHPDARSWTLYRVIRPARVVHSFEAHLGQPALGDVQTDCAAGQVVAGLSGTIRRPGTQVVSMVTPRCSTVSVRDGAVDRGRDNGIQPELGETGGGSTFRVLCPDEQAAVGVFGRSGSLIDQLGLTCAPLEVQADGSLGRAAAPPTRTDAAGGTGGGDFELSCPPDSVLIGLSGPSSSPLEGLGIACAITRNLLSPTAAEEPPTEVAVPDGTGP